MNYCGIPKKYSSSDTAEIVVLPVPYDGTSTWIKGADKGPAAILAASANMELYDTETNSEVYKVGIYTAKPVWEKSSPEKMVNAVYNRAKRYLSKNKFMVTLGGEHSVSIGAIKAYAGKYKNLTVLQLDAHSDLRQEYEGGKYNHACVMARVKEMLPIVQAGIRSMDAEEKKYINPSTLFLAERIIKDPDWINNVIDCLTENVYITIDLDVFDPSQMPSTGTPEPGGLLWYDVLKLIRKVNKRCNILGFDVVELCPNLYNKAPDFLAAKLIYKILSYRFI
ncbi:MAG: agmatinase [Bacteroidia bacterium]|nr:agmatinase [Bacteroidia bacterium]